MNFWFFWEYHRWIYYYYIFMVKQAPTHTHFPTYPHPPTIFHSYTHCLLLYEISSRRIITILTISKRKTTNETSAA